MSDLLVRPEVFRDRIEDFGYEYLSFETRKLEAGQKYSGETANRELAIVVLGGVCSVTSSRGEWLRFGERATVFDGLPYTLYLPIRTALHGERRDATATWRFAMRRPKRSTRRGW